MKQQYLYGAVQCFFITLKSHKALIATHSKSMASSLDVIFFIRARAHFQVT